MSAATTAPLRWFRVADPDELPEGRVKTVTAGHRSLALTHHDGKYGALDNRCPHQGGPLGEGSIENGLLRCPWHGWDYCPLSGKAPGFDDGVEAFEVEERDDGPHAVARPVRTGRVQGDSIEILEGLEPGDRVVVEGQFGLVDGVPVVVDEPAASDREDHTAWSG